MAMSVELLRGSSELSSPVTQVQLSQPASPEIIEGGERSGTGQRGNRQSSQAHFMQHMEIPMRRALTAAILAALFGCNRPAFAQVSPGPSPLGMTSPLGVGPASPVPPLRIPLLPNALA